MKKRFLTLCLWGLLAALFISTGAAQDATSEMADDPVVLQLGETTITRSDFDTRFGLAARSIAAQQGLPYNEQTQALFESVRPNFLDQLATQLVILNQAEALGVSVPGEDIDAEVATIRERYPDDEAFSEFLSTTGFEDEAGLREAIRESFLLQRTVEALGEDIAVSDEDVETFYNENAAQFETAGEVCARHILVETEAEIVEVQEALAEGEEFEALAQERSIDTGSGAQGGDLGCFGRGMMVAPFEEAAFSTPVGETSEPVETQFGYHLVQVYDRSEGETAPLEDVQDSIREQLQQERLGERITELRDASGVELFPENLGSLTEETTEEGAEAEDTEDESAVDETDDSDEEEDTEDSN